MGGPPGGYVSATHARWLATEPDRRWRTLDATLVFADVSGFTAMSEKLAKRGKIGAEETSEAINHVFGALLDATSRYGGEILKFGGDAVLAMLSGEGHEARGAAAAMDMQAAMRPLRRYRTAAGPVTLRLSVGVASGVAHLFLAGSAPREMLVAGPLATEVVGCESAADAGQVVASPATVAALPARCLGEPVGPGHLVRRAPPAPHTQPPAAPPGFDPRPALPLHLHAHVPGDPEHRSASVAFIQFKGSDAMLEADGGARLARVLDDLVGATAEACLAYGVTFVSSDVDAGGGKLILAAGAPTAAAGDEDRLLHALRAVIDTDWPLTVRAGVNRGRVFMVDIGPPHRRAWSVMGDAVNLAARVMARAQHGQVLATPAVLDRVRDDFARTPVDPFRVKGKSAPVRAAAVGAARGARRAPRPDGGPLVGRRAERDGLRAAIATARAGGHAVVQLVGEPGMGKSRLVEAAVEAATDLLVVPVAGGSYTAHSPYRALRAPLRELIGYAADAPDADVAAALRTTVAARVPELEPWLPLVAIPFGIELPPTPETAALSAEFARDRLRDATATLVVDLLDDQPALVVVEDGHWLDAASADLLGDIARRRTKAGSCVLVTRRPASGGLDVASLEGATELRLGPLDPADALEILDDGGALPADAGDVLVERAAGNPLLLQELAAAARSGEPLDALPDTVEALVTARIDTLSQADRTVLRHAAILGVRVPLPLLEPLLGLDAFSLRGTLQRLEGFLVTEGPALVRFRHALMRDAAYEALPYRRRRELHARAAGLIEDRAGATAHEHAELLTIHYHAAHRWEPTWRYAQAAGQQALQRAAPVEAAGFFARALEAGRALRRDRIELARVGHLHGEALRLAGRFDDAGDALGRARRDARGDALLEADLCHRIARLRERSRHMAQAQRWLTRGLHLLDGQPAAAPVTALRAQLWLTRGTVRLRSGRKLEAIRNVERAAELARSSGDRLTLAKAYTLLHWAHTELSSPERERYRGLALPIFEELGDHEWQGKALNNLGIDAYFAGRWDEAVDLYERGRAALDRVGDRVEAAVLLNNIAEIRADQGRYEEADAEFRQALDVCRRAAFHQGAGLIEGNLGRVASRRGDPDAAAELFARARETLAAVGARAKLTELDIHEAERLVVAGDGDGALARLGAVRQELNELGAQPALLALGQRIAAFAKLLAGDGDGARVRLRESVAIARDAGALYEEALSLEALGRLGGEGAEEAAARAATALAGLGVVRLPAVAIPV